MKRIAIIVLSMLLIFSADTEGLLPFNLLVDHYEQITRNIELFKLETEIWFTGTSVASAWGYDIALIEAVGIQSS